MSREFYFLASGTAVGDCNINDKQYDPLVITMRIIKSLHFIYFLYILEKRCKKIITMKLSGRNN